MFFVGFLSMLVSVKAGGGINREFGEMRDVKIESLTHCQKKKKLISIAGESYAIVEEPAHHALSIPVRTLLNTSDIDKLPSQATFFLDSFTKDETANFATFSFTSNDNPDWASIFSYPEPYWHQEHSKDTVVPKRTVNFLLQKVLFKN